MYAGSTPVWGANFTGAMTRHVKTKCKSGLQLQQDKFGYFNFEDNIMGYSTRNNGLIEDFWPDNTDDSFYIAEGASMSHIMQMAMDKWGLDITIDDLIIIPEHIHTRCLTYDRYDPSDYNDFLCISKKTTS